VPLARVYLLIYHLDESCRRRIINTQLLTEYAFFLRPGGLLYTITDVEELAVWMKEKIDAHPLYESLSEEQIAADPAAAVLSSATEEGQKVARNGGKSWKGCYRRL
jgi:tRNA (guanine-N7-)-methyltransferase